MRCRALHNQALLLHSPDQHPSDIARGPCNSVDQDLKAPLSSKQEQWLQLIFQTSMGGSLPPPWAGPPSVALEAHPLTDA
eukprot:6202975-Amphidinium_carterae.1